jgi:hypothetical protein
MTIKLKDLLSEGFEPTQQKLSESDRKQFLNNISTYATYGKAIYNEHDLVDIANKLSEIAKLAETFVMNEQDEWFDKVTVSRNFKQLKQLSDNFSQVATESKAIQQRLSALYEDMGTILSRYFDIKSVNESIVKEDISASVWDKTSIGEFLDLIGQDQYKFTSDTEGISSGDFGRVKFKVIAKGVEVLYLTFENENDTKSALNSLSHSVSNPYEITSRLDVMPTTIMVHFTE